MGVLFSGSELVNIAIGIEKSGLAFYQSLVTAGKSVTARDVFKYLADKEEEHLKTFQGMLDTLAEYRPPEVYAEEYNLYLKALVDGAVFTDAKVSREMAEKTTSDAEAIKVGLEAEKDSILFYSVMRNLVPERSRELVDRIIEEEKSHVVELSNLKEKLGK